MIHPDALIEIGRIIKPHGIKGELSVSLFDGRIDLSSLKCLIIFRDGLPVPFFISSLRPRGSQSVLLTLDGIDSDIKAKGLTGEPVSAFAEEVEAMIADSGDSVEADDDASEGFFVEELIGMKAIADGKLLGTIEDVDDSTANILLVIRPEAMDAKPILVPAAAEFFADVDFQNHTVSLTLPPGLLDI